MLVTPEALLGARVLDAAGRDVGVVLDVATPRRARGFVLVGAAASRPGPRPILRVDLDEVVAFRDGALRLRPVPGQN